jgi:hypothetical protein
MFRVRQQRPKHLTLGCSWCHWKGLEVYMSKLPSHGSFGDLQPKLWAKEGPGAKLTIWLPTTKSRESTSSWPSNRECNIALERSRRGLQLWFRPHCDQTLQSGVMSAQSCGTPFETISGLQLGSPGKKEPFACSPRGALQRILYGGRWWHRPSPGRGESCVSKCPWLVLTPKGVPECELTLLWLVLGCRFKLDLLVPLPSLILGLLARLSTPL